MALISLSSKCFNAVETALEAVKSGDAKRSGVILRSVRKDGQMLKQKAAILIGQLSQAEEDHKRKVENLTRQMNDLFAEETQLSSKNQTLQNKNSSLNNERQRYQRSKEEASRRYQEAERAKRDAEREYEKMKPIFWIPIVGWLLALLEDSSKKASEAYREMQRHERDVDQAESDLKWVKSQISEVERDLREISHQVNKLKSEREACHEKLSDIKNMVSFIMQAVSFWDEVVMVTETATVKTENLQRIVNLAGKKTDPVRILKSSGTHTTTASFKDHWMEVAEMISSDRNNMIFDKEILCIMQSPRFCNTSASLLFSRTCVQEDTLMTGK